MNYDLNENPCQDNLYKVILISLEGMSFPSLGDFAAFPSLGTSKAVLVSHHGVRCDGKSTLVILLEIHDFFTAKTHT